MDIIVGLSLGIFGWNLLTSLYWNPIPRPGYLQIINAFLVAGGISYWSIIPIKTLMSIPTNSTIEIIVFLCLIYWDVVGLILIEGCSYPRSIPEGPGPNPSIHVFIVACHNSSSALEKTLKALYYHPHRIVLADNGSTPQEIEWIRGRQSDQCQVLNFTRGNKTWAQWDALNWIKGHWPEVSMITVIDDDVLIPTQFSFQQVAIGLEQFECLGYPIRASGNPFYALTHFQNIEYQLASKFRTTMTRFGSNPFASGAIGSWNINALHHALLNHTTAFLGEDYQLGLNLHLSGGKIGITSIPISTTVPECWYHYRNHCSCGEPSLFRQRATSWDVGRLRMFQLLIRVVRSSRVSWVVRAIGIYELASTVSDAVFLGYIIYLGMVSSTWYWSGLRAVIIGTSWSSLIINWIIEVPPEIGFWFPLVYRPIGTGFRWFAYGYTLGWHWWKVPTPSSIEETIRPEC